MISFVLLIATISTAVAAVDSFIARLPWLGLRLVQQRMETLRDGRADRFPCRCSVPASRGLRKWRARTSGVLRRWPGPSAWISVTREGAVISHSWKVLVENVACCPSNRCVGGRACASPSADTGPALVPTDVLPYSALKAPRVVGTRGALPRR